MSKSTKPTEVSSSTKRIMLWSTCIVFANYIVHLFPISLIGLMGWYPAKFRSDDQNGIATSIEEIASVVETGLVIGLVFLVLSAFLIFIILREVAQLVRGGRNALVLKSMDYIMIFLPQFIVGSVLLELFQGPIAGAGLFKLGVSVTILVTTIFLAASAVVIIGYALEPKKLHLNMKNAMENRHSSSTS